MILEFQIVKGISNLTEFKQIIMLSKFWADQLSIEMLQSLLNIKIICLDEDKYKKNKPNIVKCLSYYNPNETLESCKICGLTSEEASIITENEFDEISRPLYIKALTAHKRHTPELVEIDLSSIYSISIPQLYNLFNKLPRNKDNENRHRIESPETIIPIPKPNGYIIVTYSGNHYRLVTYNGKGFFKDFRDLPAFIRRNILRTCNSSQLWEYETNL